MLVRARVTNRFHVGNFIKLSRTGPGHKPALMSALGSAGFWRWTDGEGLSCVSSPLFCLKSWCNILLSTCQALLLPWATGSADATGATAMFGCCRALLLLMMLLMLLLMLMVVCHSYCTCCRWPDGTPPGTMHPSRFHKLRF